MRVIEHSLGVMRAQSPNPGQDPDQPPVPVQDPKPGAAPGQPEEHPPGSPLQAPTSLPIDPQSPH
jgi:hypothetical protein